MKTITIVCLLLVLSPSIVCSQTQSPQQILDKMVSLYASCSSYADNGEVKLVFVGGGRTRIVRKPFSTAFVRPSRFRFEFEVISDSGTQDYVVWQDGPVVKNW
jgi:outer membrane lipoprotein-sorting protein